MNFQYSKRYTTVAIYPPSHQPGIPSIMKSVWQHKPLKTIFPEIQTWSSMNTLIYFNAYFTLIPSVFSIALLIVNLLLHNSYF